ncbi:MAG: hypothetical protein ACRCTR_02000 [Actinomycetota bacterium]
MSLFEARAFATHRPYDEQVVGSYFLTSNTIPCPPLARIAVRP